MTAPLVLVLPPHVRRGVIAAARAATPRECCGFLVGRKRLVQWSVPMTNVARGTTRYRIDDAAHIALRRLLRDTHPRVEILGVYHSHPRGAARPSSTDIAGAHYPEWTHVIVGLGTGRAEVRAFQIRAPHVRPVRLVSSVGSRGSRRRREGSVESQ